MEIRADGATVALVGDIDVRCTEHVRDVVYDVLARYPDQVTVDLSAVTSIDLTALRVLAVATRRAQRDGHRLTLRGCSPDVRRLLAVSRLMRVVDLERAAG